MPRSVIPTDFAKEALGINVTTYGYNYDEVADDIRHQMFNLTEYDTSCDTTMCRWEKVHIAALLSLFCALLSLHS